MLFFISRAGLFSQNLVLNPDFEIFGAVPCGWTGSPIDFANATSSWTSPTQATPDIFSTLINPSCTNFSPVSTSISSNGWQSPHSGDIFAGFYTYVGGSPWREYLQGELSQPMVVGDAYRVSFYISLGDNSQFSTNNIGVGFTTTMTSSGISNEFGTTPEINFTSVINDTAGWTLLCDTIIATAAWQYMIIGNYFSDANTSIINFNPGGFWDRTYYYCDDVSVEHILLTPSPLFTAPNDICPGTCTDFTNLSTNAISYIWSFPGATPNVSTDVADNGTISDTLTLNNYMHIFPFPSPQGILQNGDTLFANAGAVSYQWYFNSNPIAGATDYFYVALQSGNYNVVATDVNGCEVEAVINNVIAGLTPALSKGEEVTAYPNPAYDYITLSNLTLSGAEIAILNSLGEIVYKDIVPDNFKVINLADFSAGVYIVRVSSGEREQRFKFIKHD